MMRTPSRLAVAVHEAGHAAMRLNDQASSAIAPVRCMYVFEPDDDDLGYTDVDALWQPSLIDRKDASEAQRAEWRILARKDLELYLAGPIAEMRWRRYGRCQLWLGAFEMADRCLDEDESADRSDLGRVRRRLEWGWRGNERTVFNEAWLKTEDQVARLFPRIVALGRLLAREGALAGTDINTAWASGA